MSSNDVRREIEVAVNATAARTAEPVTGARRAALWAEIEASTAPRARRWWVMALAGAVPVAAAAAVAVAVTGVDRLDDDLQPELQVGALVTEAADIVAPAVAPMNEVVIAKAASRMSLPEAQLDLLEGSALKLTSLRAVELQRGAVDVQMAAAPKKGLSVTTEHSKLHVVAGRVRIKGSKQRTEIAVLAGKTRVLNRGSTSSRDLEAGATLVLPKGSKHENAESRVVSPRVEAAAKEVARPESKRAASVAKGAAKPVREAPIEGFEDKVERARRLVRSDASEARALAEEVLGEKTSPTVRVSAMMVVADVHRRDGRRREAAVAYERVSRHPSVGAYLEEALYRQAELQFALAERAGALATLSRASAEVGEGHLGPERAVLTVRVHVSLNDLDAAQKILDATSATSSQLKELRQQLKDRRGGAAAPR